MVEADRYDEGVAYWDARYLAEPKPADWILKPHQLLPLLDRFIAGDSQMKCLHVGCGNSLLPEQMYDAGYKLQVSIDTSAVVISQMSDRTSGLRPEMEWLVADATDTSFRDDEFDLVIDKGTLDTILCEDDDEYTKVCSYLREVHRILAANGTFLVITFGPPEDRLKHFCRPPLDFEVETIEVPADNAKISHCQWIYACRRPAAAEAACARPANMGAQ